MRTLPRRAACAAVLLGLFAVAAPRLAGQTPVAQIPLDPEMYRNVAGIDILPVQGQVWMLSGLNANITVQAGEQGVLLVDSGAPGESARLLEAVRAISPRPIRFLLNTHADVDNVGGNQAIVDAAGGLFGPRPRQVGGTQGNPNAGVQIIAHENALISMLQGRGVPAMSGDAIPGSSFFTAKKEFFANGEPVQMFYQPAAHTDGDVVVFFRASDVVSAGDVYVTTRYPEIELARGGSIQGEIDALNAIIDLAIPERNQMGGTRVIPGEGRISNESDVVEYRDMVTIIRDRVREMVGDGMTLAQIQASPVSLEYDGLYGRDPEWTREMFLEAVYRGVGGR